MTPPGGVDDLRTWRAERVPPARAGAGDGVERHPPPPEPPDGSGPGGDDAGAPIELIDPKDALDIARRFVMRLYTDGAWRMLWYWRGDFHAFGADGWRLIGEQDIRTPLYLWLGTARKRGKEGLTVACPPNARFVSNVIDALKAVVPLASTVEPACWLPTDDPDAAAWIAEQPPAAEFLAVKNGLLHMADSLLGAPTAAFFPASVSPVAFDDAARTPFAWNTFLESLWPDDPQSREALQEWFGYVLAGATKHQKIMMIVGPPRSGKSTIAKVLSALIGAASVVSPAFANFGGGFALEPLIGKSLAIVGDARLGRWSDQAAIVENLLGVSGEDDRTIPRKHQTAWTGRLKTRFMLISNELPSLGDASGAFATRLILLTMSNSFESREDPGLADRLLGELPAILNWSLDGWRRLEKRGRFVQPDSSKDALRTLKDLGSEIHAFLRDRCELGKDFIVATDELLAAFQEYRTAAGFEGKVNSISFGKKLRAACPSVQTTQPRGAVGRLRMYSGIALRGDNPPLTERTQNDD